MSDAWTRFSGSVTGAVANRSALERFDLGALAALGPGERDLAEALLIGRVASREDDPREILRRIGAGDSDDVLVYRLKGSRA